VFKKVSAPLAECHTSGINTPHKNHLQKAGVIWQNGFVKWAKIILIKIPEIERQIGQTP
jgi:hypothetical protein